MLYSSYKTCPQKHNLKNTSYLFASNRGKMLNGLCRASQQVGIKRSTQKLPGRNRFQR